jgi:hypothetical protein
MLNHSPDQFNLSPYCEDLKTEVIQVAKSGDAMAIASEREKICQANDCADISFMERAHLLSCLAKHQPSHSQHAQF